MIRVDRGEYRVWAESIGYHHHLEAEPFDELELAPPKDFKPKCYYEKIIDNIVVDVVKGCEIWDTVEVLKCVSCDIRESCIYKRE